jgi:trigger factor
VADLQAGAEKTLELTYPENFREPKLAGQTATTRLRLVSVAEGKLPEVDEEFIRSFGVEDGQLATLRDEIRATWPAN